MTLTKLLDLIDADTEIVLHEGYGFSTIGNCKVYEFPYKHHMNEYYEYEVKCIKAIDENIIKIYV